MLRLFAALDRAFDTLAHVFDGRRDPETSRSRPEAALFAVAGVVAVCALLVDWSGSAWGMALWGLTAPFGALGLLCLWSR